MPYDKTALTATEVKELLPEAKLLKYVGCINYPEMLALFETELAGVGVVISADSSNGVNFDAEKTFDENNNTFWETTNPFPHWIQYDFGADNLKKITKYTLYCGFFGADSTGRMPKDWQFQGSNDGSSWTTLDIVKNQINWKNKEGRTYSFKNSISYRYYRLYITDGINPGVLRLSKIGISE